MAVSHRKRSPIKAPVKDNFSTDSDKYSRFRPVYPASIFHYIDNLVKTKDRAWDCGTGNGQVAVELSRIFSKVEATDISENQLKNAVVSPKITYTLQPAERTNFPNDHFDLVTVAQAVHWFNFFEFYKEVKKCLKPGGIIFIIGYGLMKSNPATDRIITYFYEKVIGPYWDPERHYLDEGYKNIPFPFEELAAPEFVLEVEWKVEHLIGYLNTWSAVKHYIKKEGINPVNFIAEDLQKSFGEKGKIRFPILKRVGRVN